MADYQKLYIDLFNETTDVIEKLKKAQINAENTDIKTDEEIMDEVLERIKKEKISLKSCNSDDWWKNKYDYVYELFSVDKHSPLESECQEYFNKFLSQDEKVHYHFVEKAEEPDQPCWHLYFTNKQIILFIPETECGSYHRLRHLEFMPYTVIRRCGIIGTNNTVNDNFLAMELWLEDVTVCFIDYMEMTQAIELNKFINSHQ